jgi:Ca2+-binding EF-hand superfamily protein
MSSISLTQVTAMVVVVCMVSFFVNADDELTYNQNDNKSASISSVAANPVSSKVLDKTEASNNRFTFSSLDTDKNGKLSHQEVIVGNGAWLAKSFKNIDINTDQFLTEQELIDFVGKKNTSSSY